MGDKAVIVADDDELIRMTFRMAIEHTGSRVVDVADGDSLLRELQASQFDLCIMDAAMPGASLSERLDTIRRISPITAVVIISGYSGPPGEIIIGDDVQFMQKPIDLATLGGVLHELGISTLAPGS